jgi:PAS domain S-box-containing protein
MQIASGNQVHVQFPQHEKKRRVMAASFEGFRSLIEHSPDAISVIDPQGEILYGSASTTKIFGYEPEELVGRNCLELVHPEDRDHSSRNLKQVLAKPPGPFQWDARILHKDGNYSWVESTVSNLLSESEVQAIVVHQRDIQARRAAEEERQKHAEELTRSNARLEEFAYIAAHDLREPLRAICAYTEMLVQETQMDASAVQMAKFIVDGTQRMSSLIDDLLSFAATGMQEPPQRVDMENALAQATLNLAMEIKIGGARVMRDRLPVVRGNEIQLIRLFQNLIGNAVKYRSREAPEILLSAERQGRDWIIRVTDNGLGIAKEDQARIFMPFVRLAKREIPGTGLGLAVCKKIVDGMGGKIWVESELGAGSTFSFMIAAEDVPRMANGSG